MTRRTAALFFVTAFALLPTFVFAGADANAMCKGFDPVKDAPRSCSDSDIPKGTCAKDSVCEALDVKTQTSASTEPSQPTSAQENNIVGGGSGATSVSSDQGTSGDTAGSTAPANSESSA